MFNRPKASRAFAFIVVSVFIFIAIPAALFANAGGQQSAVSGSTVPDPGTIPEKTPGPNWLPIILMEPLPTNTPIPSATPVASCTPPEGIVATDPTVESELQSTIFVQRNSNGGLPGYTLNEELQQAARRHAKDMATLSDSQLSDNPHKGSDGSSITDRISEACFSGARMSEIVGWGYPSTSAMMSWWMSSEVHKNIILDADLEFFGPTYMNVSGSQYKHYWVVTFGQSSSSRASNAIYQCQYVVSEGDRGMSAMIWQEAPCEQ